MILRQPAIVTCENQAAFTKPIGRNSPGDPNWQVFDRNFTYPGGFPGFVNGLVLNVPAGTDINPKIKEQETIGRSMGCFVVGQYTPPTFAEVLLEMRSIYGATGHAGIQSGYGKVNTDCVLQDQGGNQVKWLNGDFAYDSEVLFRNFGTLLSFGQVPATSGAIYGGSGYRRTFQVRTERGAVVRIYSYEPGETGIVTVELEGAGVSATVANRVSDDTEQVLQYGQMYLPPGWQKFTVKVSNSFNYTSTPNAVKVDCTIGIYPEIPYGI